MLGTDALLLAAAAVLTFGLAFGFGAFGGGAAGEHFPFCALFPMFAMASRGNVLSHSHIKPCTTNQSQKKTISKPMGSQEKVTG